MTIVLTRQTVGTLLASAVLPSRADTIAPDPILAAIQKARIARAELSAAIRAVDDSNPVSLGKADAACDRSWEARSALSRILPTTSAGFRDLVRFHAADVTGLEPDTYGSLVLRNLLKAVDALLEAPNSPA